MKKGFSLLQVLGTMLFLSLISVGVFTTAYNSYLMLAKDIQQVGLYRSMSINNIESAANYFKDRMKENPSAASVGGVTQRDLSGDPIAGTGYVYDIWVYFHVEVTEDTAAVNPTYILSKELDNGEIVTKTIVFLAEGGGQLTSVLFQMGTALSEIYSVDNLSRMYLNELASEVYGSTSVTPLIPNFEFEEIDGETVESTDNIQGMNDAVLHILDNQTSIDGYAYSIMEGYNAAENVTIATEIGRLKEDLDFALSQFTYTAPSSLATNYSTVLSRIETYMKNTSTTNKNNLTTSITSLTANYATVYSAIQSDGNTKYNEYQDLIDSGGLTVEQEEYLVRLQEAVTRKVLNIELSIEGMLDTMTAVMQNHAAMKTESAAYINSILDAWIANAPENGAVADNYMTPVITYLANLSTQATTYSFSSSGYTKFEFSCDYTTIYNILIGIMEESNRRLIEAGYSGTAFQSINYFLGEISPLVSLAILTNESSFNTTIYNLKSLVVEMLFPEYAPYDLLAAEYLSDPITSNYVITSTDIANGKVVNLDIQNNATVVINNSVKLLKGSSITMEPNTLLIINGDLNVYFDVGTINSSNYETFEEVVYIKTAGATIIVTGDIYYDGYRAGDDLQDLYQMLATGGFFSKLIAIIIRGWFQSVTGLDLASADLDLRVPLEGNFLVMGDVQIGNSTSGTSNPRIRTTWYVKGHFDGSYMSTDGFYNSPQRANFVFARAITLDDYTWTLSERDGYAFFIAEEEWAGASVYNELGESTNFYSTTPEGVESIDNFKTEQGIVNSAMQAGLDCTGIATWGLPKLLREGNYQEYIMY